MIIDVKNLFQKIRKEGFVPKSLLSNFIKTAPDTWEFFFMRPRACRVE
jgi:hypothetical protein